MRSSLAQLISYGSATQHPPREPPIREYLNSPATFTRICRITSYTDEVTETLSRDHDVGYIHSIIAPQSHDFTFEDCIVIEIGDTTLWHMPLKLLEGMYGSTPVPHMTPPMKKIKLPENLFPIFTISLAFHTIRITLKCCENSYLTLAEIVLDSEPRRYLASTGYEYDIVSCSSIIQDELGTERLRCWNGPTIGFFVDTSMAPSYEGTVLSLNQNENTLTPDIAEPLPHSSSTLYYSLIGDTNPLNAMNSMKYTQSSLNMSRIDNVAMKHTSRSVLHAEEQVQCFVLTRHTLRVSSGMTGARFENYNYSISRSITQSSAIRLPISQALLIQAPTFTNRPIPPDEDSMCCITMDTIGYHVQYAKCGTCRKNFTYEPFSEWYRSHRKCPMCRSTGSFTYYCNTL
jgi:hypothetical protein